MVLRSWINTFRGLHNSPVSDLFPSFTTVHFFKNKEMYKTGEMLSQCQSKSKPSKLDEEPLASLRARSQKKSGVLWIIAFLKCT